MSVVVELTPDVEEGLAALAREQGLSLPSYLSRLLSAALADQTPLSVSERARAWRESALGSTCNVSLSDEAMSRESIYASRG